MIQKILGSVVARTIAFIVMVMSGLLLYLIPFVDDVPYYQTMDDQVVSCSDFTATEATKHGSVQDESILIVPGEGEKMFYMEVSLMEGELFRVSFDVENATDEPMQLVVDLNQGGGYDLSGMEQTIDVAPGSHAYEVLLPYYRAYRPPSCNIRLFTFNDTNATITNLKVQRLITVIGNNPIVKVSTVIAGGVLCISSLIFLCSMVFFFRERKMSRAERKKEKKKEYLYEVLMYMGITGVVLITICILYRNVDIVCPINISGDAMGVHYYSKLIDEYGISLVGHRTGGLSGADMYDYPYSDTLSFLLVKLIGVFTNQPFLISNLFYFLCFFLIAYSSAACMRYFGVGRLPAASLSILYAFTSYIQQRYGHMWLVPYFMMPVACMIALCVIRDTYHQIDGEEKRKQHFSRLLLLSFSCAFTGLYYAFFACALIAIGTVILLLNRPDRGVRKYCYPFAYLGATLSGVVSNVIPNAIYHMIHGPNLAGELQLRQPGEAEIYGLKLVQMFLPHVSHRIKGLADLTAEYGLTHPLINENNLSTLGLVASIGLVISLLMLLKKNTEKEISYLIISVFLLGTIGGISSVLTVFADIPIRCYNRLSVVIMFLALLQLGILLGRWTKKWKPWIQAVIFSGIMVMGLYDQTFTNPELRYEGSSYKGTLETIQEIEAIMPEGAYIFEYPYSPWPTGNSYRSFYGYIDSDHVRWSYGAMQGREESIWQGRLMIPDMASMIRQLQEAGYTGLFLDTISYNYVTGEPADDYVEKLENLLGEPAVQRDVGQGAIYFWKI